STIQTSTEDLAILGFFVCFFILFITERKLTNQLINRIIKPQRKIFVQLKYGFIIRALRSVNLRVLWHK
ncbi:MAG: hypothetical protein ACQEXQ_11590, partial [Bacillota bacterium]